MSKKRSWFHSFWTGLCLWRHGVINHGCFGGTPSLCQLANGFTQSHQFFGWLTRRILAHQTDHIQIRGDIPSDLVGQRGEISWSAGLIILWGLKTFDVQFFLIIGFSPDGTSAKDPMLNPKISLAPTSTASMVSLTIQSPPSCLTRTIFKEDAANDAEHSNLNLWNGFGDDMGN